MSDGAAAADLPEVPPERLAELLAITRAITDSLDYGEVLDLVVHRTAELFSADACVLILADASGIGRVAASVGVGDEAARALEAPLDERIAAALRELLGYDAREDAFMGAPVVRRGAVQGILAVYRQGRAAPDDHEAFLLSALADQAAIALAHAAHHGRVTRQLRVRQHERDEYARELADANEAKDRFFNALSHELRTPLSAMQNSLSVLKQAGTERQRAGALEILERNVQIQTRLVDDLLDLSRVMRGKLSLEREPVDLRALALEMVDGLAAEAEAKGQTLRRPQPDGPLWVEGDRGRLGQVLVNLVTNSIRYTPRGGHIRVDVGADGGAGRVRVRDDGQGMDASMLEHLFEPFRQADDSLARSGGGLGIGLSIAHGIVALHGGTLEAFSEGPGRGSELVLRLPLADQPEAASDAAPEDAAGRQRVLLVDDNRDIRESTSMLLQVLGHDVVTCADAGEALARIDGARPSLVLVDIGLPDMDGYTLARRLRAAHGPGLRLVAVTGYATDDHRRRSREAGFDDHLVKPVSLEQLEHLLVG